MYNKNFAFYKLFGACFLIALIGSQADANVLTCDAGLVAAGLNCEPQEVVLCYAMTSEILAKLVDDVAEQFGYPTITCLAADVAASRCAQEQLGAAVETPETKQEFASRMVGFLLAARVYNRDKRAAAEAAAAAVTPPAGID